MSEHLKGHKTLGEMVSTHIAVYRDLLTKARDAAGLKVEPDLDDASHFQHELNALGDIETACVIEAELAPSPGHSPHGC